MKKILIIEDDKGINESLCDILELSGYNTISSSDGKEGYKKILSENPDLVICDINMPELNGFELLGAINQRLSEDVLPVFIFLTAKVENQDIRQGLNLGADDYVTKPFDLNELLEIIKMRLEKRDKVLKSMGIAEGETRPAPSANVSVKSNAQFSKIAIPSSDGLEMVQFENVLRCEADRAYCQFFLKDKNKLMVSKPLKEFEETLLAHEFMKVHKSHIVNLNHVIKYVRGANGYLVMSDNTSVPVSSRRKEAVLERLRQGLS